MILPLTLALFAHLSAPILCSQSGFQAAPQNNKPFLNRLHTQISSPDNQKGTERSFHQKIGEILNSFFSPSRVGGQPTLLSRIIDTTGGFNKENGMNVMKFLSKIRFPSMKKENRRDNCQNVGGVFLNKKCVEYMGTNNMLSFQQARFICQKRGGDLWTPNLRDPFLYQKIMKYLPEIAGAKRESIWIGVEQINGRAEDINGNDVTDSYLIQIYDEEPIEGRCFVLDYPNGQFKAKDLDCRIEHGFVCQYPVEGESVQETNANELM